MIRDPKKVATKTEFLQFLEELLADLKQNSDAWENPSLERYLEAIAAWVNASDSYYRNSGQPSPANVSWRFFAEALTAARIYE